MEYDRADAAGTGVAVHVLGSQPLVRRDARGGDRYTSIAARDRV
jgi:hypothetical protein